MKTLFIKLFLLLLIISCGNDDSVELEPSVEADNPPEAFFANVLTMCGEVFIGEATFPEDPGHELVGVELTATIETCTENEIQIPFHAGEDESRTWIIRKTEDRLLLKHDHRYPDGTPHELTNYGGHANNEGSSTRQYFEADTETAEMLPEASTNVWMLELEMDTDPVRIVYYLERNEAPRFRAELFNQ